MRTHTECLRIIQDMSQNLVGFPLTANLPWAQIRCGLGGMSDWHLHVAQQRFGFNQKETTRGWVLLHCFLDPLCFMALSWLVFFSSVLGLFTSCSIVCFALACVFMSTPHGLVMNQGCSKPFQKFSYCTGLRPANLQLPVSEVAMGQNSVPPVNIPIPTKIEEIGWCTYPKMESHWF